MVSGSGEVHRLVVRALGEDPRDAVVSSGARLLGHHWVDSVTVSDVFVFAGDLDLDDLDRLGAILVDPLLQTGRWEQDRPERTTTLMIESTALPGVTDAIAATALAVAHDLGIPVRHAASVRRYDVGLVEGGDPTDDQVERLATGLLSNPVVEHHACGRVTPTFVDVLDGNSSTTVERYDVATMTPDQLAALNVERGMALDPAELVAIADHFRAVGRPATDVELETLAQTWSEHCAHKTFRANVELADGTEIEPLLGQLRRSTEHIAAPFVRSAFVGNAGIVSFEPGVSIAVKAETHNHPSAIEPFGGANTGVGGVIRDVLGAAHRPVALTDVLCFGPLDVDPATLPAGVIHPRFVRDGVVAGVADYGNKIGLPTVAGAVVYDAGYTANPLVFCGCVGVADDRPLPDGPFAGDLVVAVGGRTGRDGIRGATFSSATMDATTGDVAGASVQIGDPIVEKLVMDFLDDALEHCTAITDCGAGGFSSAVGEMAEHLGADVELAAIPLKYHGLAAWEIWLSEAQERMVLAVAPDRLGTVHHLADRHGVELTVLGTFTGDGILRVRSGGAIALELPTSFLHDGRPRRRLTAELPRPRRDPVPPMPTATPEELAAALLALLEHPDIASKADVIRGYDHEIRGATLVRPLLGRHRDAPADATVIAEPHRSTGLAIGIGVNPWMGVLDPERMARAVVDEAIRNVVAVGADPDRVALMDNFSWGDPRRPTTLGDLVAAVRGCCDAAAAHRAPFVSGKDSLNNEYTGVDGVRRSVPPTLVVTAVAPVPDADRVVTPELCAVGDVVILAGRTSAEFGGSHLALVEPRRFGVPARDLDEVVPAPDPDAPARYRTLHELTRAGLVRSCHDVSDGGLAVALAEMALAGDLGVRVDVAALDRVAPADPITAMFAESIGRLVIAVRPDDAETALAALGPTGAVMLGVTTDDATVVLGEVVVPIEEIRRAFTNPTARGAAQ